MPSKFWEYLDNYGNVEGDDFWDHFDNIMDKASMILIEECPDAANWVGKDKKYPLMSLLTCLASSVDEFHSPLRKRFEPTDVVIHTEEEFKSVLFQRRKRGHIAFTFDVCAGFGFHQPSDNQRMISHIRDIDVFFMDDEGYNTLLEAGAIGFIRGKKIDLYPFPENWIEHAESVRRYMDHMTAKEKAEAELTFELKSFVDLLGWDKVNEALTSLKTS